MNIDAVEHEQTLEEVREPRPPRMLYACAQLPWPLDGGHKIVSFNDIRYLSAAFRLTVMSFVDDDQWDHRHENIAVLRERLPGVEFLEPVHQRIHTRGAVGKALQFGRALRSGYPYIVSKYRNAAYLDRVVSCLKGGAFQWLFVESTPLGYVLSEMDTRLRRAVRLVFRPHDKLAETLESYASRAGMSPAALAARLDAAICRRFERRLWESADAVLPVTRRLGEMIALESDVPREAIFYFPVFVERPYLAAKARARATTVLYVGTTRYPPNRQGIEWFIRVCWPRVRKMHADARLIVVGRGSSELSSRDPSIAIHDYVDDLDAYYDQADVFIVPLFSGSGIRLKILDAMRRGIPVVSTTVGYAGLEVRVGCDLLVADEPDGFASHVGALLASGQMRNAIAGNATDFLLRNHDPERAESVLGELQARLDKVPAPSGKREPWR